MKRRLTAGLLCILFLAFSSQSFALGERPANIVESAQALTDWFGEPYETINGNTVYFASFYCSMRLAAGLGASVIANCYYRRNNVYYKRLGIGVSAWNSQIYVANDFWY